MSNAITAFTGSHRWLSNFAACSVTFDGKVYTTVEHAYQAAKSLNLEYREAVRYARTAGEAKRLGKLAPMRHDWEDIKEDVMLHRTQQKYQHEYYRQLLAETGSAEIMEGNTWGDTFWGVCNGQGQNKLGHIIMAVRSEILLTL
jgi:N-glycosidase YbiA